ncbi:MAG: zinc ribbon domain-containing protein [Anaerolineaceae bacterium]|nr:zinc ribbon domain-containing protein [Anaerolineaceae bacterium]
MEGNPVEYRVCPSCGEYAPKNNINCPNCGAQLVRFCPACGEVVERNKNICDRCGVVIDDYDKQKFLKVLASEQRVRNDREKVAIQHEANERENRQFVLTGVVIWIIILIAIFVILGIAISIYYKMA